MIIGWSIFLFLAACVCDSIVELAGKETVQVRGTNKVSLGYSNEFIQNMKASKDFIQSLEKLGLKPSSQEEQLFQNASIYYHPQHSSPRWIYQQTTLKHNEDLDHKARCNFHAFMFLHAISKKLPIPVVPAAFALPKKVRKQLQLPSILQPEVPNSVPFSVASPLSYQTLKSPAEKGSLHKALSKSKSSVKLVLKSLLKRSQENNVMGQTITSSLEVPVKKRQLKRVEILTYICRLYWLSRFMGLEEVDFEGWFVHSDTLLPFKYDYTGAFDTILERIKRDTSPLFLPYPYASDTNEGSSRNLHPLLTKLFDTEKDKESFLKILQISLDEVSKAIDNVINPKYFSQLLSDPYWNERYGMSAFRHLALIYSLKDTQAKFKVEMKKSIKDFFVYRVRV